MNSDLRMTSATRKKTLSRYQEVSSEKADGATYTPQRLADFVANQIVAQVKSYITPRMLKVLDPAVGEGALLISLLTKLREAGVETVEVYGFETNQAALFAAKKRISLLFPNARLIFFPENFLEFVARSGNGTQGLLFTPREPTFFDLIIANPPYVRTQILGSENAQHIARQYSLTGRVDLYYAFVLAMGQVLAKDGVAGIIVSNRFMTTRSGKSIRKAILESLQVKHVWDLGDTKLFDAAVLPAVLLLECSSANSNAGTNFTSIYETSDQPQLCVEDPIEALKHVGIISIRDGRSFKVQTGVLDANVSAGDVWRVATRKTDVWLATVKSHTWGTFGDIGKVRVGVKTCGDKVFIRSDWSTLPETERPELLLPVTTHHIARRFRPNWELSERKVVYPHTVVNGKRGLVDLNLYPRTRSYFEKHRETLANRKYVVEAGREWFEMWVPQDPAAWTGSKLVFRDISEAPTFWIDQAGTIVNGDCYWLKPKSKQQEKLLWLALAVANSRFIEEFYDHSFNNKLYAGRRRFITQYVEKFPLPNPESAQAVELIALSKQIYEQTGVANTTSLEETLDETVYLAFGVQSKKSRGSGI